MYNFNPSEFNIYSKYLLFCRDDGLFHQEMDHVESSALVAKGSALETSRTEFGLQMRSRSYFYPFIILLLVLLYF